MYFIRYITLAILSTIIFTTAVDAKALDSLTKEQKEIYLTLQTKYQSYTEEYKEDFGKANQLQTDFITNHQSQFDKIITLENQFKEENKENIDKLNLAKDKFKENYPNAVLGPKKLFFDNDLTTDEKYNYIYSQLVHHQKNNHHSHMKLKTELQKKFFQNNKQTILALKNAHKAFIKEHNDEFKSIQDEYNNFYEENQVTFEKVSTLKSKFINEHKSEIEQLGSAAPMFFHEIGVSKKFKY